MDCWPLDKSSAAAKAARETCTSTGGNHEEPTRFSPGNGGLYGMLQWRGSDSCGVVVGSAVLPSPNRARPLCSLPLLRCDEPQNNFWTMQPPQRYHLALPR